MSRNKMIDVIKGISILMVIADHFDMVIPTQSVYLQAIEHSFFMTYMVMLYISTSNEILFFAGMGAASVAATLAYHLFSHVRVRVAAWRNPWADIDGGGYQILNSLFAITTWGLLGSGLTKGMPNTVPVVESDFIFAAICEEMGILFGMGIVCLYIMLFFRGILVVIRCQRRYYSLLAAGVVTMFAFQALGKQATGDRSR